MFRLKLWMWIFIRLTYVSLALILCGVTMFILGLGKLLIVAGRNPGHKTMPFYSFGKINHDIALAMDRVFAFLD